MCKVIDNNERIIRIYIRNEIYDVFLKKRHDDCFESIRLSTKKRNYLNIEYLKKNHECILREFPEFFI